MLVPSFITTIGSHLEIPDGINPIERVEIIPNESEGEVTFDELVEPGFWLWCWTWCSRNKKEGRRSIFERHLQWIHDVAVYSNIYTTHSKVNELENQQIESSTKLMNQLAKVHKTAQWATMALAVIWQRSALRAVNQGAANIATINGRVGPINLVSYPPNIFSLWNKYGEVSVGSHNPAKKFMAV